MLTSLLVIPVLGVLALSPMQEKPLSSFFLLKEKEKSTENETRMKQIALFVTVLNFLVSLLLWGEFDSNTSQYQFTTDWGSLISGQDQLTSTSERVHGLGFCHFHIGVDGLSLYFVLLTTFTMPICILASWENVKHNLKYFLIAFLMVETLLIALFVVLDLLLFYVFFESVLVPLFLIVGIWGATETRIRASFLLFLYTLFGSLFMLLAFLVIIYNVGTSDLQMISLADISFDTQKVLWLAIFLSFAIKTPLIPFHTWLINAHVEAPVRGSMVLAGLVLKLATYGILRILIPILPEACAYYTPLASTFRIVSIIYASVSALRQTDFKCLIAYSSIAHMGVVLLGLFSNTVQGVEGALLLSLGHGFVSPALFYIVGSVIYDRYHTRTIRYYRGLVLYMPLAMSLFFIFTLANMGTPGISVNWVGELLCLTGTYQKNPLAALLGRSTIVLSAGYSIWLFNRLAFGSFSPYLTPVTDLTRREYIILLSLMIPTVAFGLWPNIILNDLHYSVSTLLYT